MEKNRLEAFSGGVIAIVIAVMVFDIKPPPTDPTLTGLRQILPAILTYLMSYVEWALALS